MTVVFLVGLVAATVAVVRCRLPVAAGVLFGVLFLVPGNLVLVGFHPGMRIFRIVLWAYAAGLVLRVLRGEIDLVALRPTRVQAALSVFLAIALLNGVALSTVENPTMDAALTWLALADQLVVLTVVLVTCRVLGVWRVATMVAVAAVAMGSVAAWEHFSETSYARWWYFQAGREEVRVAAEPLTPRGSAVRVRGPYQFALEFSWVAVMVLPAVLVVATRARRRLALAGPAVLALALLWSWSRSSLAGLLLAVGLLVVASRFDRRALATLAAAAGLGLVVFLSVPQVQAPFDAADEDSAASRTRRLALITEAVVDEPYTGLGLAGLRARDIRGADASFTLVYAALGVPGVAALAFAQATALATCAAGLRRPEHRPVAAAALAGVAAGVMGNFALDLVAVPGSGKTFWIVAGLGAAAASSAAPVRPPALPRALRLASHHRWSIVAAVAGLGIVVSGAWPAHAASNYRFETIERPELARTDADVSFGGRFLVNTACELIDVTTPGLPPAKVECLESRLAPGVGSLRIETDDPARTEEIASGLEVAVQEELPGFTLHEIRSARGTPTPVRTLPFWLTGVAVAIATLAPGRKGYDSGGANVTGCTSETRSDPSTVDARSGS